MKKPNLFAIYRKGEHLGNERGFSTADAIKKYLIASSFETLLDDSEFVSQYSSNLAVEYVHFPKFNSDKKEILEVQKSKFDYWAFIEQYCPKYSSSHSVLLSDILTRKLHGEEICEEDEELIKDWDVRKELFELDKELLCEAFENFFNTVYPQ
ncbi:hypothetical protein ACNQGB_08985 [Flavobacterium sp. XS1P32]|uniref:hypothetical protein n=1 Tax=Flavobacterium sp. XS1P32 TaxID=3401726 RepID=UPI003AAADC81